MVGDCFYSFNVIWIGVLDFFIDFKYKLFKDYLESMLDFFGKRKFYVYFVVKLKGEEFLELVEGLGLVRRLLVFR